MVNSPEVISQKDILFKEALLIRRVEELFLQLFSQGKVNGTVHTCIGQEFSALSFAGQLRNGDIVFSNHRCHGHFIAFTKDVKGLIAELLGKKSGVCAGIGSSQHLCKDGFYSNGIQGGIVPVAAGMALGKKLDKTDNIALVYIGDGTLGEGVLYETMNLISKHDIPLLIVCENNFYAQSTHQSINLSGEILDRPKAFDIKTFKGDTWNIETLREEAKVAIDYVRANKKPAFFLVETYRLAPHSKGDDDRSIEEINGYSKKDPLNIYALSNPEIYEKISKEINLELENILNEFGDEELLFKDYFDEPIEEEEKGKCWEELKEINHRQVELINRFFTEEMERNEKMVFIGEDVLSPYGGAFKVAKGLSFKFPERVISSSISEAAIVGIGNGLALAGYKPFIEIMFGDFVTLALDQIINHASKFYHMYNKQVTCPVVVRTPMGGRRGYGPTHSQSLEKFLVGIDNVTTVALNAYIDPQEIYTSILSEQHAVIALENKLDYGKKIAKNRIENYKYERNNDKYPVIRIRPIDSFPNATIVTYGGMVDPVLDSINDLFDELDLKPEVIVLSKISPINYKEILDSVNVTGKLYVAEEGSGFAGIGSEIISTITEKLNKKIITRRIAAYNVPIPSVKSLEEKVLPAKLKILEEIQKSLQ